jgi:hypothetical protein
LEIEFSGQSDCFNILVSPFELNAAKVRQLPALEFVAVVSVVKGCKGPVARMQAAIGQALTRFNNHANLDSV